MDYCEKRKMSRDEKVTILIISHEGKANGAPLYLERLVSGLPKSIYRVVVFFADGGPIVRRLQAAGYEVYFLPKRPPINGKFRSLLYRVNYYWRFTRTLWIVRPDIVYSSTIVNCGEVVLSRMCGIPNMMHMHEGIGVATRIKRRLRLQAAICDDVIVGSEYAGRVLFSLTGKVGCVVPVGISAVPVTPAVSVRNKSVLRVGILGTLEENKGQMLALEALALALATGGVFQLFIAGAEDDRRYSSQLRTFVADNKLEDNVFFLGKIESIESFFESIDVLVVCSYDEVFPTVILEAMREKKLVVATRVGGIPEIIENGFTGLLYEPGDPEILAKLLVDISENYGNASQMIERAYLKFLSTHEMSKSIESLTKRFGLLLAK